MISIILAGGQGLRLWPESRRNRPKQLCKFFSDKSMLEQTINRLKQAGSHRVIIITNEQQRPLIKTMLDESDLQDIELLSEPQGKNTAPAVGLALARLRQDQQNDILGIFPADHYVGDEPSFVSSLEKAIQAAETGRLVTIGVKPRRPETGYGYIEKTRWEIGDIPNVYQVDSFCEKPDKEIAQQYVDSGQHLWNAGIYIGNSQTFMDEFALYLPEIHSRISSGFDEYVASYASLPDISLDYGIAEKSNRIAVVPSAFDWCDLGSWSAMDEFYQPDQDQNIGAGGNIAFVDSQSCLVKQKEKALVLFGVENLLVVESDDIILVADRNRSQDLRQVIDALKNQERFDLL
ncbi:MAG TPA: mannose-1-phosphate guanylyltransferase [Syntrophomonadaceae bacterium]|nr:mannose-1-phosphate guanylyltransferase [Syntrophomonadaceae bacterium]